MRRRLICLLAGTLAAGAAAADTMRCGQWVINEQVNVAELLEKCGPSTDKDVKTEDVYGPSDAGPGRIKRGTTTTERWRYDRGSQLFVMVVLIVDGKVKRIERER